VSDEVDDGLHALRKSLGTKGHHESNGLHALRKSLMKRK
jgi:hypothetical protein